MKKPFLHALGAALYIVAIVSMVFFGGSLMEGKDETIVAPMAVLSLFVLSAAVMGFLFLYEPLQLLIENRKQEALVFFAKVVGFFACFVAVFGLVVLLTSKPKDGVYSQGKIDVEVACRSALAYTTFMNNEDAEAFVVECIDGEHPDVIQRYIESLTLDGATI